MSLAQEAREIAKQAKQEQARQRAATALAERRRIEEQRSKKLHEIDDFAARLPGIVRAAARNGERKAFIAGGIKSNERNLWMPVKNRCKALGVGYHMYKNHIPSCIRVRVFYCKEYCGNTYHLEVSW